MEVKVLNEAGYDEALLGISLSFNQPLENMPRVATKLAHRDGGHNKFLESLVVWLDIEAPRYWWMEFDTYRVGTTKQSESTMHTILRSYLGQDNFEDEVYSCTLEALNTDIESKEFQKVKDNLPESFLQRRIVCTNYKTLRNIFIQRANHKLELWRIFIREVRNQINHPRLLPSLDELRKGGN